MKPIQNLFLFHSSDFYIRKKTIQWITYFAPTHISLIFLKAGAGTSNFLQRDSLPSDHLEAGEEKEMRPWATAEWEPFCWAWAVEDSGTQTFSMTVSKLKGATGTSLITKPHSTSPANMANTVTHSFFIVCPLREKPVQIHRYLQSSRHFGGTVLSLFFFF